MVVVVVVGDLQQYRTSVLKLIVLKLNLLSIAGTSINSACSNHDARDSYWIIIDPKTL